MDGGYANADNQACVQLLNKAATDADGAEVYGLHPTLTNRLHGVYSWHSRIPLYNPPEQTWI